MIWSKLHDAHDMYQNWKTNESYLDHKIKITRRPSLQYKNRALNKSKNLSNRVVNCFVFKGLKLKYIKIFQYAQIVFMKNFSFVNLPHQETNKYKTKPFLYKSDENPILDKLFSESDIFLDFDIFLPYFIQKELPMIKPIITVKKNNKKKKSKRIKNKYNISYVYVPESRRILTSLRWFSMKVKFTDKDLITSYLETSMEVTNENEESFLIKLKNQVYAGLAAEHD